MVILPINFMTTDTVQPKNACLLGFSRNGVWVYVLCDYQLSCCYEQDKVTFCLFVASVSLD